MGRNRDVFFTRSAASRQAGKQTLQRIYARTQDQDKPTTWATRQAQYDAVCTWGIPNHALLERLRAIEVAVLVANGDSDPMILLAGLIPNARVKLYPDAAHGSCSSITSSSPPTSPHSWPRHSSRRLGSKPPSRVLGPGDQ